MDDETAEDERQLYFVLPERDLRVLLSMASMGEDVDELITETLMIATLRQV